MHAFTRPNAVRLCRLKILKICFCLRTENRARKTHVFGNARSEVVLGWGWGGHVNVLCSAYIRCSYIAEISGFVATLHVATLPRSLVSLLRYMLLRCRDLWCPCYVTCCYAAEISGFVATLHVATLPRSLVSLLRYMLLRCRDLWFRCYVTCCYAAEMSGVRATLHVATLQGSLVSLLRFMCLPCRHLWCPWYVTCCYAAEISGVLATLHVATLRIGWGGVLTHRFSFCLYQNILVIHVNICLPVVEQMLRKIEWKWLPCWGKTHFFG